MPNRPSKKPVLREHSIWRHGDNSSTCRYSDGKNTLSQHFLTQERYNLDQIASARDAVKSAQSIFKDMQEKGIITIEADDDPAMMEEEPSATKTESSRRIMEGLEHMTSSLENLANQADKEFAEEQQQKKRACKDPPGGDDATAPAAPSSAAGSQLPPAMEPFGGAHRG